MRNLLPCSALVISALILPPPAGAADWPQWQGPSRDLASAETGLLKEWPEGGPTRLWLYEDAGLGYAGPAIVDGRMYTMIARDGVVSLLVLDAATGEELANHKLADKVFENDWGDGPRSTPTIEGDRLYCMTARGVLTCLSLADGEVLWRTTMKEHGGKTPTWGYAESPLVDGDLVLVTPGVAPPPKPKKREKEADEEAEKQAEAPPVTKGANPEFGAVVALDKLTGEVRWRSTDVQDGAHYSSIQKATIHGRAQYVQLLEKRLIGLSAADGKLLWESPWNGRIAVIPTPTIAGNQVYVTSGYGVGCKLVSVDAENNAVDVYENKAMKNHHGGVMLLDGHVFGHSDGVGWVCQDLATGGVVWKDKRSFAKGALGYADGMFYLVSEGEGEVVLVTATTESYQERGRFKLDPQTELRKPKGKIWVHPVIVDGRLYLRDQDLIYCYDVSAE